MRLLLPIIFLLMLGTAQAQTGAPTPPNVRATAAIVLDDKTGAVLFAKNPDKRLPPASTTKIMTAWLLARDTPPEQIIVTPPEAAKVDGGCLGMTPGEKFTARDILYAMLLPSANDACIAAAKQHSSSVPAFVARMNQEAQKLGLPNTNFVNPNGLPAPNHVSSARDLARLAQQALRTPVFAAAVRAKTYSVPRANGSPTKLVNRNELLWTVPGMDGVKTGQTQEAGFCFVGSATRKGRRIITVVLDSPNWQAETMALLKYGFSQKAPKPGATPSPGIAAQHAQTTPPALQGTNERAPHSQTVTPVPGVQKPEREKPSPTGSNARGSDTAALARSNGSTSAKGQAGTSLPPDPHGTPTGKGQGESGLSEGNTTKQPLSTHQPEGRTTDKGPFTGPNAQGTPTENRATGAAPSAGQAGTPPSAGQIGTSSSVRQTGATPSVGQASLPLLRPKDARPKSTQPTTAVRGENVQESERKMRGIKWLLLLLFLLAIGPLCYLLRTGKLTMKTGSLWPFAGRRKQQPEESASSLERSTGLPRAATPAKTRAVPSLGFVPPQLERLAGIDWLSALLDNQTRLLEPAVRRQAQAFIGANPALNLDKIFALLSAPKPKTRLIGSELLIGVASRSAEETLVSLIEDEKTPTEVRSDAIDLLRRNSGDRYESLFLKILARDGSQAAARALASLPRLDAVTISTLCHIVSTQRPPERDADSALRTHLLTAQSACVLRAHNIMEQAEIKPLLERLPISHREQTLTGTLRGVTSPWAVETMVNIALKGQSTYPALQNLLECDPRQVRAALDALPELDSAARTRAMVLRRLLFGEGEIDALRKLAEAGDDTANNALKLERLYRWHPSQTSLDALLAAAMLTSLRLGFTAHTPEQIAPVFRTMGEDGRGSVAASQELEPLRQAYSHPEVYDAVQVALNTEDGVGMLVSSLSALQENHPAQEEMAFWSDKLPAGPRLSVAQSLATCESEAAHKALASLAADPDALVRASALCALHTRGESTNAPPIEVQDDERHTEPIALDKAA